MKVEKNSRTKAEIDLIQQDRLRRCVPIAKKVTEILQSHMGEITMGGDPKDVNDSVESSALEVIQLFLDENLPWNDKSFVMQLAQQPLAHVADMMETSFQYTWDRAVATRFGGKDSLDITFRDVDEALKP
jgi:hypothetical protein